jgi:hypothetical protein
MPGGPLLPSRRGVLKDDPRKGRMPKTPADRPVQEGWSDRSADVKKAKLGTPKHYRRGTY